MPSEFPPDTEDDVDDGPERGERMHQPLPVDGYKPQSEKNVQLVVYHKQWEERALRHLDWLAKQPGIDGRWLAIGRTQMEKSFMAVNRSVFQPGRIALPEDLDGTTIPSNQRPYYG